MSGCTGSLAPSAPQISPPRAATGPEFPVLRLVQVPTVSAWADQTDESGMEMGPGVCLPLPDPRQAAAQAQPSHPEGAGG